VLKVQLVQLVPKELSELRDYHKVTLVLQDMLVPKEL
jgi:hypothetical protein